MRWIDSDILPDHLSQRTSWRSSAQQLLMKAAMGEIALWVSPLIVANVFYVQRNRASQGLLIKNARS